MQKARCSGGDTQPPASLAQKGEKGMDCRELLDYLYLGPHPDHAFVTYDMLAERVVLNLQAWEIGIDTIPVIKLNYRLMVDERFGEVVKSKIVAVYPEVLDIAEKAGYDLQTLILFHMGKAIEMGHGDPHVGFEISLDDLCTFAGDAIWHEVYSDLEEGRFRTFQKKSGELQTC